MITGQCVNCLTKRELKIIQTQKYDFIVGNEKCPKCGSKMFEFQAGKGVNNG